MSVQRRGGCFVGVRESGHLLLRSLMIRSGCVCGSVAQMIAGSGIPASGPTMEDRLRLGTSGSWPTARSTISPRSSARMVSSGFCITAIIRLASIHAICSWARLVTMAWMRAGRAEGNGEHSVTASRPRQESTDGGQTLLGSTGRNICTMMLWPCTAAFAESLMAATPVQRACMNSGVAFTRALIAYEISSLI